MHEDRLHGEINRRVAPIKPLLPRSDERRVGLPGLYEGVQLLNLILRAHERDEVRESLVRALERRDTEGVEPHRMYAAKHRRDLSAEGIAREMPFLQRIADERPGNPFIDEESVREVCIALVEVARLRVADANPRERFPDKRRRRAAWDVRVAEDLGEQRPVIRLDAEGVRYLPRQQPLDGTHMATQRLMQDCRESLRDILRIFIDHLLIPRYRIGYAYRSPF